MGWSRRGIGAGAVVGLLVLGAAACGSSTTEVADEPSEEAGAPAEEPTEAPVEETTTTLPVGPMELRLEGMEDNGVGTFDRTARVLLDGACDGEGECAI